MAKLKLRVLTGNYESIRALREGAVTVDGVEFEFPAFSGLREMHRDISRGDTCDVGEYNGPAYVTSVANNRPLTGIPVFLHRRFRHGFIWINKNGGIKKPQDLIGKKIGGPSFLPACNVWVRGLLENEYGVSNRSVTWVMQRDNVENFTPPPDLKIVTANGNVEQMLLNNEIQAIIAPNPPLLVDEGNPNIVPLWPNYKEVELEYYKKRGIFPIMHITTIKKEIADKNPWVIKPLMDAFERSKKMSYARLMNPRVVPLVWYRTYQEEEQALFKKDPWEYGLSKNNRDNLDTLLTYVQQQGLSDRKLTIEELFTKESLDWDPTRVGDVPVDPGLVH
jgi:4,5-dihydroxyphthalate decarboxylase